MPLHEALAQAAKALSDVSDTPRLDAEVLMAHALGVTRNEMLLGNRNASCPDAFAALLDRRLAHEPIAYIIGERDFWTISLSVGPGVLIPRADSETLIEAAVAHFGERTPNTILDLGTGPGTLLLAALNQFPKAIGLGIDASETALNYACHNAEKNGLSARATFKQGDWAEEVEGWFDLILCNPPYVESEADIDRQVRDYEPSEALFAGADGLDDYRRLAPQIARLLGNQNIAVVEIGHDQADAVSALFEAERLVISIKTDLGGRDRCLIVRRTS